MTESLFRIQCCDPYSCRASEDCWCTGCKAGPFILSLTCVTQIGKKQQL